MGRILYFDENDSKPKFVWNKVVDGYAGKESDYKTLTGVLALKGTDMDVNPITGLQMDWNHRIDIYYDDSFACHPSLSNKAVVTATDGLNGLPWRGPLFAYCGKASRWTELMTKTKDMGMTEYSHVIAWLIADCNHRQEYFERFGDKVDAVKVICDGVPKVVGESRFVAAKISRYHPVFRSGKAMTPNLARRIGLPLLWCLSTWTTAEAKATTNSLSILLANKSWMFGNRIIAQADYEGMSVDIVEAFFTFCHRLVSYRKWQEYASSLAPPQSIIRPQVLAEVTAAKWSSLLADWQKDKVAMVQEINEQCGEKEVEMIESLGLVAESLPTEMLADGMVRAVSA